MSITKEEKNRRLRLAFIVIALVTIAFYADRFVGNYTGGWKDYAYIVGIVFAIGAGLLTVTDVFGKKK